MQEQGTRAAGDLRDFAGVVVGAGAATRFGGSRPKQFCDLGGRSVIERSVEAIAGHAAVDHVVVVLAAADVGGDAGRRAWTWPGVTRVVVGGETRLESVRRGLTAAGEAPFVLVHDAARPLVPPALVDAVVQGTRRHGACVPGLDVHDTVKQVDDAGAVARTLDRRTLRLAQTPQGARRDWLAAALERVASRRDVTDEGLALELAGRRVAVVPGAPDNLKITTRDDLEQARRSLGAEPVEWRVGNGFDIHRFGADRDLVLGGVRFPGEPGLVGHSDADVILHAAMDALLGALALGDIGHWFPPEDERWRDADSAELARQVAAAVRQRGYRIVQVDLTLLAERPRIRGRSDEMRQAIASALGLQLDRVGLKATTLEGLGALGRSEGIACQAVAMLQRTGDPRP